MGRTNATQVSREKVIDVVKAVLCASPPNQNKAADLFCMAADDEEFCRVLAEVIKQNPGCARRTCSTIDESKLRQPVRDLLQRLVWNDQGVEAGRILAERELMRRHTADRRPVIIP